MKASCPKIADERIEATMVLLRLCRRQKIKLTKMNSLMDIHLHKVRLFGYHGLEAGEEILGGEFEVSVTATFVPSQLPLNKIDDTVDYTALLSIVKQRMQIPAHLLETLATEIGCEIIAKFAQVTEVTIFYFKLHPPIQNFEGSVGVTYKIKRD